MIHFSIILPSQPASPERCLPFAFSGQNFLCISDFCNVFYALRPPHPPHYAVLSNHLGPNIRFTNVELTTCYYNGIWLNQKRAFYTTGNAHLHTQLSVALRSQPWKYSEKKRSTDPSLWQRVRTLLGHGVSLQFVCWSSVYYRLCNS